jgi:ectoine hydroxylase-related dioxygenase (phytanoyl-CoA dioxygenase family)
VANHPAGASTGHEFWKDFHGNETKRITGLADMSPTWGEVLCDSLYKGMADHYLGEDNYHLNTGQLICIGPGETPQLLHRDELNWPEAAGKDTELTVTAIFALTDFTEENGATVIAPGSHRWPGRLPAVEAAQTCHATMTAGSALLYSGKVIHGGGSNSSLDQWRVGLHAGFVLGWLRAEENHQLTTSIDTARCLPEHAQRMLGFRSFTPPKAARLGLVNYEDAGLLLD